MDARRLYNISYHNVALADKATPKGSPFTHTFFSEELNMMVGSPKFGWYVVAELEAKDKNGKNFIVIYEYQSDTIPEAAQKGPNPPADALTWWLGIVGQRELSQVMEAIQRNIPGDFYAQVYDSS